MQGVVECGACLWGGGEKGKGAGSAAVCHSHKTTITRTHRLLPPPPTIIHQHSAACCLFTLSGSGVIYRNSSSSVSVCMKWADATTTAWSRLNRSDPGVINQLFFLNMRTMKTLRTITKNLQIFANTHKNHLKKINA